MTVLSGADPVWDLHCHAGLMHGPITYIQKRSVRILGSGLTWSKTTVTSVLQVYASKIVVCACFSE